MKKLVYYIKLLKFGWKVLRLNFAKKKQLFKLTLSLTNNCNSRCTTCNIWKSKFVHDFSTEDAELFFKKNRDFLWVDLTGGEVFLRNDLLKIVESIKNTQKDIFLLHIPTNSLGVKKIIKDIKEIIALDFPKFIITVSLDGIQKTNDQIRGINGHWKKAVGLYKKLRKMKTTNFESYFGMTISKYNFSEVDLTFRELQKEIPDLRRNEIHYNLVHSSDLYYKNGKTELKEDEIKKVFNKILGENNLSLNPVKWLEKIYQKKVEKFLETSMIPIRKCRAGEVSLFINETGSIYPCTMWNKKIVDLRDINFDLSKLKYNFSNVDCCQCWTPCEAYQNILVGLIEK